MKIKKILEKVDYYSDYIIWSVAVVGMFGSLYFSEGMQLAPCNLCWYQRVLLYPLVAIYSVAILKKETKWSAIYSFPLVVIGLIMSFYQTLLQWGVLKESELTCSSSSAVPCGEVQINWLGFITIPFMAFSAFLLITLLIGLRLYLLKQISNQLKNS